MSLDFPRDLKVGDIVDEAKYPYRTGTVILAGRRGEVVQVIPAGSPTPQSVRVRWENGRTVLMRPWHLARWVAPPVVAAPEPPAPKKRSRKAKAD